MTLIPMLTESMIALNCERSSYGVKEPLYVPTPIELILRFLLWINSLKLMRLNFCMNY